MEIPAEVLIAYLRGEVGEAERAELERWLAADPAHRSMLTDLRETWDATDPSAGTRSQPVLPAEIIRRAEERRPRPRAAWNTDRARHSGDPPRRRAWWGEGSPFLAAACAGVVLVGTMGWILGRTAMRTDGAGPFAVSEVRTGPTEVATVTFDDGTVARLAPESALSMLSTGEVREVTLDGEAFFAVASRDDRPFLLRSGSGVVRVTGTRFSARSRTGSLEVVVLEGEVELSGAGGAARVGESQVARILEGSAPLVRQGADPFGDLRWMGDFLALESSPLYKVAIELSARFDLALEFDDAFVGERTVSGWFAGTREELAAALCRAVGATCTMEGNRLRMTAASHPQVP